MQQQKMRHEEVEEELNEVKAQLGTVERQRDRALEELREIRRMNKSDMITSSGANNQELSSAKESLANANKELKIKDKTIESLRSEVDKVKQLELKLAEKDASLHAMKEDLNSLKASVARTEGLLSDSKKKVEELEAEVGRRKESETKLFDSFAAQTSQLEQASMLVEKFKLRAASLDEKMQELEDENRRKNEAATKEIERLQHELQMARENTRNEGDKSASVETKPLVDEIGILKNELKLAMEAEDNSKKAMDDLALALKEVATECNQAKEKLKSTEQQLEAVKEEAEKLKKMAKCTEQTYEALLSESKKESDRLKNTVDRLRSEAEESLLAWSEKEIEFVKCIKKADAEKNVAQEENAKLMESMREVEGASNNSKEETRKLRDILKQALNEANVAKEAASLAQTENSYLKDSLAEKDKALLSLAQETERLRINEAEANESIKELKRIITSGSKKEAAKLEKENKEQKKAENKEQKKAVKKEPGAENNTDKEPKERRLSSTFSFDLNQLWPVLPGITAKPNKDVDETPKKDDALVGSIFDLVESPMKDPTNPPQLHHRRTSSACSDDEKSLSFENFEEGEQFDDLEIDRTSQGKRKALLRRFGDLLRRKNSHPSPKDSPKEMPHPQKEIPV